MGSQRHEYYRVTLNLQTKKHTFSPFLFASSSLYAPGCLHSNSPCSSGFIDTLVGQSACRTAEAGAKVSNERQAQVEVTHIIARHKHLIEETRTLSEAAILKLSLYSNHIDLTRRSHSLGCDGNSVRNSRCRSVRYGAPVRKR